MTGMFIALIGQILFISVFFFMAIKGLLNQQNKINIDDSKSNKYKKYFDQQKIDAEEENYDNNPIIIEDKKNYKAIAVVLGIVIVILVIIGFVGAEITQSSGFFALIFMAMFIGFLIFMLFYTIKSKKKSLAYKNVVIQTMLNEFYPGNVYKPFEGLPRSDYVFKTYSSSFDEYHSEDSITLPLEDNKSIYFSEVKTVRITRNSEGKTRRTVTFRGIVGHRTISKTIENDLFIGSTAFFRNNKVKMDNDEFNKKYDVISTNEMQVYKLLTPSNMDKFMSIKETIPTFQILLQGNKVHFKFSQDNLLESKDNAESSSKDLAYLHELIENVLKVTEEIEKEIIDKL